MSSRVRIAMHRLAGVCSGFVALHPARDTIKPSLRAGVTSSVVIIVAGVLFGPQLGVIALFGTMIALWEVGRPFWARMRNILLIATAMCLSMLFGVLVAPYRWATVAVIVAVVIVTAIAYYGFLLTRGPGPLHLFYGTALGTYFGQDPHLGWMITEITVFACFATGTLTLLSLLSQPGSIESRSISSARGAVNSYVKAVHDSAATSDRARQLRNEAHGAVNRAWLTLDSVWPANKKSRYRELQRELLLVNQQLALAVMDANKIPHRTRHSFDVSLHLGRPSFQFLLRHAVRGDSVAWFTAWRMGLGALVAAVVSEVAAVGHPYWAVLTSTIILHQWVDRIATTRRAAHRAVGTIIGLLIVVTISALNPTPWWTLAIVIVCLIGQDILLPLNYGVALVLTTPMALLSIEATGNVGSSQDLVSDRLLATVVGAAVAVLVTWATSYVFPQRLLRAQSERAAKAIEDVQAINTSVQGKTPRSGRSARIELQHELIHHLTVLERAISDAPALRSWREMEHGLMDEGYLALAMVWRNQPDDESVESTSTAGTAREEGFDSRTQPVGTPVELRVPARCATERGL